MEERALQFSQLSAAVYVKNSWQPVASRVSFQGLNDGRHVEAFHCKNVGGRRQQTHNHKSVARDSSSRPTSPRQAEAHRYVNLDMVERGGNGGAAIREVGELQPDGSLQQDTTIGASCMELGDGLSRISDWVEPLPDAPKRDLDSPVRELNKMDKCQKCVKHLRMD